MANPEHLPFEDAPLRRRERPGFRDASRLHPPSHSTNVATRATASIVSR